LEIYQKEYTYDAETPERQKKKLNQSLTTDPILRVG